jgi:endonuclease/exonuclease/phosphatase family metal-dependent hydrolase
MKIRRLVKMSLIAVVAFTVCFAFIGQALAEDREHHVKVMTRNMDAGTDFNLVAFATTEGEFAAAVGATIEEIVASNIPARAARLAAEIAKAQPDVIALQEVTTWNIGSGSEAVELDQLELLMHFLKAAGQNYKLAAVQTLTYIEIPDTITFTDHNAILVRSGQLNVLGTENHTYQSRLPFPTPSGYIWTLNGWMTADIKIRDSRFRLFNTHLSSSAGDDYTVGIQVAQTEELVTDMNQSPLPVILAGDFNSDAEKLGIYPYDLTPSYDLIATGYSDAWQALHPSPLDLGLTWPLFGEDWMAQLPVVEPMERIDLIFSGGPVAVSIEMTGTTPNKHGLYASDHAGVVAVFDLMKHCPKRNGKK